MSPWEVFMLELHPRLYIGDQSDCTPGFPHFAVVHACKAPCHQQAVGYRVALPHDSRYYLALEMPYDLYLNLIDPPTPLFRVESFRHFREFAACQYVVGGHALLIHCNQGQSRAPMLALLFLAKDLHVLPDDSYAAAVEAFQRASCHLTDPFICQLQIVGPTLSASRLTLLILGSQSALEGSHDVHRAGACPVTALIEADKGKLRRNCLYAHREAVIRWRP
jgi:hypothetical protein